MFKVSVVTTLYNYRDYIIECIRSFLGQDFLESEIIIVDDGSTDDPYKDIRHYESDRVRYLRTEENYGYSHAKNIGIKNSKAEVIVMLDADDMLTKNGISIRYNKLQEGYDLVHGPVLDLKGSGKKMKLKESKLWRQWLESEKDASCYRLMHAQSVMLKKDVHRKVGLYDETLRYKSDREMWARVFNRSHIFKIGWVDDYVSIYRRHPRQMINSKEKKNINSKLQKHVLKLIEKRRSRLPGVEILV